MNDNPTSISSDQALIEAYAARHFTRGQMVDRLYALAAPPGQTRPGEKGISGGPVKRSNGPPETTC